MMNFKKALPRRAFLRGVSAGIALPLLDAMVPAFAGAGDPALKPVSRLGFIYVPNGIMMDRWTPSKTGADFEITPILEPLTSFRDHLTVISGLAHSEAKADVGEAGGDHARASASFLTGVHPKKTEGVDLKLGVSVDQIAARELGKHAQLASLELALDSTEILGGCEPGYTCAYSNSLCWRSATTPMPMENHPRVVFEHMFGDASSTDPKLRLARMEKDRSILDFVSGAFDRLIVGLGASDRTKLNEYLDAIRELERRIQSAEEQSARELPSLERPVGIPATFGEHAKLMFDLQLLAFQCDLTRVVTFMLGHEQTNRAYREIGIPDSHHPLTHHGGDAEKIAKVIQINTYHTKTLAYFLDKLRSTPDGDGTLLDHSLIAYGGGLSDGNMHKHEDLPVLLLGGGAGRMKGNRHIQTPSGTPMPNLYVSILEMLNVPVENLAGSTGKLDLA